MPNNYVLLDRNELNSDAASVTFDNIPQSGYTDLKIVVSARSTATPGAPDDGLFLQVNAITSGYSNRTLYGLGSGSGLSASNSYGITSKTYVSAINTANSTANTFSNNEIYIPNYRSSFNKSMSIDGVVENNATSALANLTAALLSNTAAINALTLTPNSGSFVAGCTFSLYGLAQVGTTPAIAPKADGGNVIGTDGTYWYHAFLSNGTFTPQVGLSCDVLAVGGGGGAGGLGSGGGGGGVIPSQSLTFNNAISYAIGVGGGGTGAAANDLSTNGGRGTDTTVIHSAGTITAFGGGGGVAYGPSVDSTTKNGGSGGGGGGTASNYAPGTGVAGQGFAGGNSMNGTDIRGGGGGGYSAVGGNAVSNAGGNGGQGYNLPAGIQGVLTGMTHVGSGGGGNCRGSVGTAGVGGTGAGNGSNNSGVNATSPTMYGCGGASSGQTAGSTSWGTATAGYPGVVVIRYLVA
jgi:hypothetical protein